MPVTLEQAVTYYELRRFDTQGFIKAAEQMPFFIGRDDNDLCDGFQPGSLVAVVFHMADKDHWTIFRQLQSLDKAGQLEAQDTLKFDQCLGHARCASDEYILCADARTWR